MKRGDLEKKLLLIRANRIRTSRKSFWEFCKLLAPSFYKDGRTHLELLCDVLQKLYEGTLFKADGTSYRRLILNLPP